MRSIERIMVFAVCGLMVIPAAPAASAQEGIVRLDASALALQSALHRLSGPPALRNVSSDDRGSSRHAADRYDVVALMVEFQQDTSRFTTGDGTFDGDLYGGLQPKVDPLPHDVAYFEAHLDFLEHYVERISDGKTTLSTHLLPEAVRLSQPMRAYSPTGPQSDSPEELRKLARLVQEAWSAADERYDEAALPQLDPTRTAFVIFHAGVGRDIELIGTTLDKTPEDLPSLFFDGSALDRLLEGSELRFAGLPVSNTAVLPRTETRRAMDFIAGEPFLLELSINGMLAASFFNFLGVPDLFNTAAGESAIGPFGLMDPLGIFAFRGLFPPEPMAWTKQYLGWSTPEEGVGQSGEILLAAASDRQSSPAARISMTGSEYFLVENRHRDPEGDGLIMQIRRSGEIVEQRVSNGDPDFNHASIDGFIGGVVVGVDNYDFALPGGLDEDGNELNGGILIWHIDERRIRDGLSDNTVNADPERRGVDLEEADGAQDIGFPSGNPFAPQFDQGSPFDFFYRGNPVSVIASTGREVRLYRNRFGPDTFPNSNTNARGPSFIVIEDFSEPSESMSFVFSRDAVSGIRVLDDDQGIESIIHETGARFGGGSAVSMVDSSILLYGDRPGSFSHRLIVGEPISLHEVAATKPSFYGGTLAWLQRGSEGGNQLVGLDILNEGSSEWAINLPDHLDEMVPASPIVAGAFERTRSFHILMKGSLESAVVEIFEGSEARVLDTEALGEPIGLASVRTELGDVPLVVGRHGAGFAGRSAEWTFSIGDAEAVGQPVFGRDTSGMMGVVPLTGTGRLLVLRGDGTVQEIDAAAAAARIGASADDTLSGLPLLAPLDSDDHLDVLTTFGRFVLAFTQGGAVVENFPIEMSAAAQSQPLVARFAEQGQLSIFLTLTDGYLYGLHLSSGGETIAGFPLAVGRSALATPLLKGNRLYAVAEDGEFHGWELPAIETVWWGEHSGGASNQNFVHHSSEEVPTDGRQGLLVARETYNWPNPIRNGETHLRCATTRPARVTVTIIDVGGRRVDEIEMGTIAAGAPAEVLWQTNAESGLYFARVRAVADGGEEETRVVKMAVVR